MKLILASTSPYRKALLERAGIPVKTCAPQVDESITKQQLKKPQAIAETLAQLKAESGHALTGENWIIGSDQLASLDGRIFDKPGTETNALTTLMDLQGQTHQLITSVHLITPKKVIFWSNVTQLTMRPLSESEIKAYIRLDQPLDCAGAYKLERSGIRLFSKIDSSDFTAIQGLPMIELCNHLYEQGFDFSNTL